MKEKVGKEKVGQDTPIDVFIAFNVRSPVSIQLSMITNSFKIVFIRASGKFPLEIIGVGVSIVVGIVDFHILDLKNWRRVGRNNMPCSSAEVVSEDSEEVIGHAICFDGIEASGMAHTTAPEVHIEVTVSKPVSQLEDCASCL